MKKIKLLITGSAGFIMGNYVRRLIYLIGKDPNTYNYTISSIDRVTSGSLGAIYNNKSHSFHIADLTDKHILDVIFKLEKPDIVIHGAAMMDNNAPLNDLLQSNVIGTKNIIDMCKKYDVRKLYALRAHDSSPYDNDLYMSKDMSNKLLSLSGLNYSSIRLPLVFGPRQDEKNIVPLSIKRAIDNKPIIVDSGTGGWTHVFDICSAINAVLDFDIKNGFNNIDGAPSYGVFDATFLSNKELAKKIYTIIGSNKELVSKNDDKIMSYQFWRNHYLDISKIGWKPDFVNNFDHSLNETVSWYLKNRWFYSK